MFETGYRGGFYGESRREVVRTDHENWDLLENARASFRPCMEFEHDHGSQIIVMEAGSYGGDILDESNSHALRELIDAWQNFETHSGETAPEDAIDWHTGLGNYIWVCVNPELVPHDILVDMISTREAYDEYPVLDESDYSEREWKEWNESLEWGINSDWDESYRQAVAEWVTENYYGYSEPGWVDPDWVTEATKTLTPWAYNEGE